MNFNLSDSLYDISKSLLKVDFIAAAGDVVNKIRSIAGFINVAIIEIKDDNKPHILAYSGEKNRLTKMLDLASKMISTGSNYEVTDKLEKGETGSGRSIAISTTSTCHKAIIAEGTGLLMQKNSSLLRTVANLLELRSQIYTTDNQVSIMHNSDRKLVIQDEFSEIVGRSKNMLKLFSMVNSVAKSDSPVVIYGQSGTGKELVARAIHSISTRKDRNLMAINCSAIPEALFEAELFGYEKGAFTGAAMRKKGLVESADEGTLFFDEIGDLPISVQPKLLRLIQEKTFLRVGGTKTVTVDFRLIAATNKDLELMVKQGTFREDLYYRINVIPIKLPALSERREDIPLLVNHFREQFCSANNKSVKFTPKVIETLIKYPWPGNVRELKNIVERLIVMAPPLSSAIADVDLSEIIPSLNAKTDMSLSWIEKDAINRAMNAADGNREKAARLLEITLRQLNYKLQKYNIKVK